MKLFIFLISYSLMSFGQTEICPEAPKHCHLLKANLAGDSSLKKTIAPVFITGASVSDDYGGVDSPAKKVVTSLKLEHQKKAYPHTPSPQILKNLKNSDVKKSKTLISVDLFFWDADKSPKISCEKNYVGQVINQLKTYAEKLILAPIPMEISKGDKDCVKMINQQLKEKCTPEKNCTLMKPVTDLGESQNYFQKDGLHLSDEGSAVASEQVCEALLKAY